MLFRLSHYCQIKLPGFLKFQVNEVIEILVVAHGLARSSTISIASRSNQVISHEIILLFTTNSF